MERWAVDHLQESGASIHRRRRRRRAIITLTIVPALLIGSFVYAAAYVQGLVGTNRGKPVTSAACDEATTRIVTPGMVSINVYNATSRDGLAASVAELLQAQGFKVDKVGNDPLGRSILDVGEVRRGPTGASGAILVATRLRGVNVVSDNRIDTTVDIVLGNKYRALVPHQRPSPGRWPRTDAQNRPWSRHPRRPDQPPPAEQ